MAALPRRRCAGVFGLAIWGDATVCGSLVAETMMRGSSRSHRYQLTEIVSMDCVMVKHNTMERDAC